MKIVIHNIVICVSLLMVMIAAARLSGPKSNMRRLVAHWQLNNQAMGVLCVDSGTVTYLPAFAQNPFGSGASIRMFFPRFNDVPVAFEFGLSLRDKVADYQIIGFSANLPF